MSDPKNAKPGDLSIDVSDIAVVDITPEQIIKLVKLHEGADKAMSNIERLKAEEIERAGINEKAVQLLLLLISRYVH